MRTLPIALGLSLAAWANLPAVAAPAPIARAVAATGVRSADNIALDASRKPVELLGFFGLQRGHRVLDMFGANGYWAEIMAPAVGSRGRVTVWQPTQFYNDERRADFIAGAGRNRNVQLIVSPFQAPELPAAAYDLALINLDYHDVYWENPDRGIPRMEASEWLARLYAAMKPGGVVGVVDHVAVAGSPPRESVARLHRIDPAVIKADFARAGFRLEAESPLLRNPADVHSQSVFDKSIRGRTDRVVLKFRKPRR
jgi:predicted methyltransferase